MSILDRSSGGQGPMPGGNPGAGADLPWILGSFQMMAQPHGHEHHEGCSHGPGESCGSQEPHIHDFAFCVRINNQQPEFLSMIMVHPEANAEPGIMAALRAALFEPMIPDAPRPPVLLVASEAERTALDNAGGTYGMAVMVDPQVGTLTEQLGQMFANMHSGNGLELPLVAPTPGSDGIDEKFAAGFLTAVREFFKASPWRDMEAADLFRIAWPDGKERFVCLMGQGGQEFGALFFHSLADFAAFNMASVSGMLRELKEVMGEDADIAAVKEFNQMLATLPENMRDAVRDSLDDPPDMPEILGLNFAQPEETPAAMEAYLNDLDAAWLQEDLWPMMIKYEKGSTDDLAAAEISRAEFALVRDAALALTQVCGQARAESSWPPPKGFKTTVSLGSDDGAPALTVEYLLNETEE